MLAAGHRLRRRQEFTAAMRGGRRAGRGSLVVHLVVTPDASIVRVGFVVSKAVGGAVVRNKVRRRLRHLVRPRLAGLPPGTHLVVRALPGAADRSYSELGTDLDAAVASARDPRSRGRGRAGSSGSTGRGRGSGRPRPPEQSGEGAPAEDQRPAGGVSDDEPVSVAAGLERGPERGPERGVIPAPTTLGARIVSMPIVAYRRWISPGLPPVCRFHPSCSVYALTAIATHGPLRGMGLAVRRLLRCHPFHPGGIDPVPPPRTRAATTRLEL